jgi:hypothetical protein
MTLPVTIDARDAPTGSGTPNGIITALKSQVPNVLSYVVPTSSTGSIYGSVSNIVTWSGDFHVWDANLKVYFQIEFKERYVFATHYSLKGSGSGNYIFSRVWDLYGFDSEGDVPTLITTNTSVGSTYCGDGTHCKNSDWGTFEILNPTRSYRFLRFQIKEKSVSSYDWKIVLTGFEVFGIYSKDIRYTADPVKITPFCLKSCPVAPCFPFYSIAISTLIHS